MEICRRSYPVKQEAGPAGEPQTLHARGLTFNPTTNNKKNFKNPKGDMLSERVVMQKHLNYVLLCEIEALNTMYIWLKFCVFCRARKETKHRGAGKSAQQLQDVLLHYLVRQTHA